MRFPLFLLIAVLTALPVMAEEPTASETPLVHPRRQTLEDRFGQANLAHDGHLTLPEAKAGFKVIAKHFDEIDIEHKGYVTVNDVRAWQILRKAARRLQPVPEKPKPLRAFRWRFTDPDVVPVADVVSEDGHQPVGVDTMLRLP